VQSLLFEKMLWASKVKESQESPAVEFKRRDYSHAIVSPEPPEHLKLRIEVFSEDFQGMKIHRLEPKSKIPRHKVFFLHGGSYVLNATRPHWRFLANLVESTGCGVIAPDYPLAPLHTYAEAYQALVGYYRVFDEARREGETVVMMGDSAGGGLCLGLCMALRDERLALPSGLVLLSPWLDVTMSNPHIEVLDPTDPFLNVQALKNAGLAWAGGANPRKPWISPLYGNLAGLPAMHLFIGTKDVLAADARRFRGLCLAAKADLSFYEYDNMVHDWMLLDFKEAKMAAQRIAEIVKSYELTDS
jgi:acetyl esterase/lipase